MEENGISSKNISVSEVLEEINNNTVSKEEIKKMKNNIYNKCAKIIEKKIKETNDKWKKKFEELNNKFQDELKKRETLNKKTLEEIKTAEASFATLHGLSVSLREPGSLLPLSRNSSEEDYPDEDI